MHPRARNKPGVPFVFYKRTSESLWREEVRHNFLFLPSPFKSLTHPVQGHVSSQKAFATSLRLICDVRLRGFFFFLFPPPPFPSSLQVADVESLFHSEIQTKRSVEKLKRRQKKKEEEEDAFEAYAIH